jgi:hypothetical protein
MASLRLPPDRRRRLDPTQNRRSCPRTGGGLLSRMNNTGNPRRRSTARPPVVKPREQGFAGAPVVLIWRCERVEKRETPGSQRGAAMDLRGYLPISELTRPNSKCCKREHLMGRASARPAKSFAGRRSSRERRISTCLCQAIALSRSRATRRQARRRFVALSVRPWPSDSSMRPKTMPASRSRG